MFITLKYVNRLKNIKNNDKILILKKNILFTK